MFPIQNNLIVDDSKQETKIRFLSQQVQQLTIEQGQTSQVSSLKTVDIPYSFLHFQVLQKEKFLETPLSTKNVDRTFADRILNLTLILSESSVYIFHNEILRFVTNLKDWISNDEGKATCATSFHHPAMNATIICVGIELDEN